MFYLTVSTQDAKLPPFINDDDFFFGGNLLNVDWNEFFDVMAPSITNFRRAFILNIAEWSSMNPLILLASIMVETKDSTGETDGVEITFNSNSTAFIEALMNEYYKNNGSNILNCTDATFAIWRTLGEDEGQLREFLTTYATLKSNLMQPSASERSVQQLLARNDTSESPIENTSESPIENTDEELMWPFPTEECWDIGLLLI